MSICRRNGKQCRPWLDCSFWSVSTLFAQTCLSESFNRIITIRDRLHLRRLVTKPTKWHVRPVKTQISLGICPVWSVFAVHMKKAWVLSYPLSAQQRLWSDWADVQADLSLAQSDQSSLGAHVSMLVLSHGRLHVICTFLAPNILILSW